MEQLLSGQYMVIAWIGWGLVSLSIGYIMRGRDNVSQVDDDE